MTRHSMFEELQSAYKAHHSTETKLVKVFNDIMLNVDSGSDSFLILLDLPSALIPLIMTCYVLYLSIICVYQVQYVLSKLLKSFLTGRTQADI